MFEFEVAHQKLADHDLPDHVKVHVKDFVAEFRTVALIPWEEHCTEGAVPQCYSTCDLYSPRMGEYLSSATDVLMRDTDL